MTNEVGYIGSAFITQLTDSNYMTYHRVLTPNVIKL